MEIVFLGTGGGRFNLISQVRRTGGFIVRGRLQLHIDPGPGALTACHDFSIDPGKTDAVVVTHNHIDHLNDAEDATPAGRQRMRRRELRWLRRVRVPVLATKA